MEFLFLFQIDVCHVALVVAVRKASALNCDFQRLKYVPLAARMGAILELLG